MSTIEEQTKVYEPEVIGDGTTEKQFTSVSLEDGQKPKKVKIPRRILHFSDGILEEFSTDEDEDEDKALVSPPVDPKTLTWLPWMWFCISTAAYKTWIAADFCGEKLAWFFGITSPKYQSAIDEYYRRKEEEEREKEDEKREDDRHERREDDRTTISSGDVQLVEQKVMVGENLDKY